MGRDPWDFFIISFKGSKILHDLTIREAINIKQLQQITSNNNKDFTRSHESYRKPLKVLSIADLSFMLLSRLEKLRIVYIIDESNGT